MIVPPHDSSGRLEPVLERLHALHPRVIDLSLGRIEKLLNVLGNPQRHLPPVIHVAGTNGKGSTCAFLRAIAESAGLQWVNSDADKIASVRAAIAAEPKPIHVPREKPAPVVLDEGPLVLVETKRDLSQLTLPFQQAE